MATRMQQRRGTAQQWTDADPRLESGEIGFETDTNQFKIGDGVNVWSDLSYFKNLEDLGSSLDDYALANLIGAANGIASLNDLGKIPSSQLPDALSFDAEVTNAVSTAMATEVSNRNTAIETARSNAISVASSDATTKADAATSTAANALSTHNSTTINVHGIANTAALATKAYVDNAAAEAVTGLVDGAPELLNTINELADAIGNNATFANTVLYSVQSAQDAAEAHAEEFTTNAIASEVADRNAAIGDHSLVTANVHGIANTLALVTGSILATELGIITSMITTESETITNAYSSAITDQATDFENALANLAANVQTDLTNLSSDVQTDLTNLAANVLSDYTDAISAHGSDTTNVHGIADTTVLTTATQVATAKQEAIDAAANASATALSNHASDTTDVHGIADTAELATKSYADAIGTTATNALALKAPLASPTFTGTVVLPAVSATGHIIPSTDNTYNLGSPTHMFKDIYVGPGSLYVNGQKVLQDESGAIVVSADINENLGLRTSGSGNIELDPTGTGSVNIKGPLVVEAGANFSSADGNGIAFGNGIKSDSIESKTLNTDLSLSGNGTGKVYLNDNAEVNGNLVVGGNLTVSGTTTSVNTETISLADNIIDLNSNFTTGTPTENSGIRVVRGDSNAVQVRWNESTDKWEFTTDGTNYSVIAPTDSPTFTGTVTIPAGASISGFAPLASPTFTGTVTVAAAGVAFTDGTQTKAGVPSITNIPTAIAAGAHSLAAGRADQFIPLTGAVVITLPSTGYSTGQSIDFFQESSTGARFESTNSVVGTPGLKFRTTNSVVTAMKTSSGWLVFGDLSA